MSTKCQSTNRGLIVDFGEQKTLHEVGTTDKQFVLRDALLLVSCDYISVWRSSFQFVNVSSEYPVVENDTELSIVI